MTALIGRDLEVSQSEALARLARLQPGGLVGGLCFASAARDRRMGEKSPGFLMEVAGSGGLFKCLCDGLYLPRRMGSAQAAP